MRVKVNNLNNKNQDLKNLIKEYEDNFLNFYNVINECDSNWNDPNSVEFFKTVALEKIKVEKTIIELKQITSIYDYIINKYGEFGKNIYAELKQKNTIINSFNNFINNITAVINSFNNVDANFSNEARAINNQKQRLQKIKNEVINIRDNVNETINLLEDIEEEINNRIANINIEYITESNIEPFLLGDTL